MAAFHIDDDGNIWIGQNTSNTFTTALAQTDPSDSSLPRVKFYVTKDGALNAISGEIGGIIIDKDGIESDNYDVSTKTGWRLDNANGVGNYFDIDIQLDGALSDDPSTGRTTLDFGNSKIFDFNNDLFLDANDDVIVKSVLRLGYASDGLSEPRLIFGNSAATSGSSINPIMGIESTLVSADTYGGSASNLARKIQFSNGSSTAIMVMNSENEDVEFKGNLKLDASSDIYLGTDPGSNGDVLTKQNGNVVWASQSGNSHPDSDHTFVNHVDTSSGGSGGTDALTISGTGIRVNFGTTGTRVAVGNHDHGSTYMSAGDTSHGTHIASGHVAIDQGSFSTGTGFMSGSGSVSSGGTISISGTNTRNANIFTQHHYPTTGNTYTLGHTADSMYWKRLYAQQSTYVSSDQRLKTEIIDIPYGLDYINSLEPKQYEMARNIGTGCNTCSTVLEDDAVECMVCEENGDTADIVNDYDYTGEPTGKKHFGFLAQDLVSTPPEPSLDIALVDHNAEHDSYVVAYDEFIAPLVKAVQELSTQISDLTARIEVLEG